MHACRCVTSYRVRAAQGVPVFVAWRSGGAAQPSLEHGHRLHPFERGFAYLVAIMDWYARRVLSWRISNSMEAAFCVDCLADALRVHGKPECSTATKGRSSPVRPSPGCSCARRSRSAWTGGDARMTIPLWKDFAAASNMRMFISTVTPNGRVATGPEQILCGIQQ
jgi:hypothetical protein